MKTPSPIPRLLAKLARGENAYIVIGGDSVTWGLNHANADNTYTAFLCRLLAAKYPNSTVIRIDATYVNEDSPINASTTTTVQTGTNGQTITVFRCGVGGDTVLRLYRRLHNIVQGKTDLVTIMLGINDSIPSSGRKYAHHLSLKQALKH